MRDARLLFGSQMTHYIYGHLGVVHLELRSSPMAFEMMRMIAARAAWREDRVGSDSWTATPLTDPAKTHCRGDEGNVNGVVSPFDW